MVFRGGRVDPEEAITDRECEVLRLIALGLQDKYIALILAVSPHTVNDYTKKIFKKLAVRNRIRAAVVAAKLGII